MRFGKRKNTSPATGEYIEQESLRWLQQQNLTLVERNFRCRLGEIDLIMEHDQTLVFVEVRYRTQQGYGGAAASVDRRKQQKLRRTASYYLATHPRRSEQPCRFDVLAVGRSDSGLDWQWIQAAFY